jgi:hypothetical protein
VSTHLRTLAGPRRLLAGLVLAAALTATGVAGPASATQFLSTGGAHTVAEPRVTISGEPIVHTFTGSRPEQVEATWAVRSPGGRELAVDGELRRGDGGSDLLAEHLTVEYGTVAPGGGVAVWYPAGTLAAPRGYAEALGQAGTVDGTNDLVIAVRVGLDEPAALLDQGAVTVAADFVVVAMATGTDPDDGSTAPDDQGNVSAGGGATPSGTRDDARLAVTGAGIIGVLTAAVGFLLVGEVLRRGATRAADGAGR